MQRNRDPGSVIDDILSEAEHIRSSLQLLRHYSYKTAVLDVLRSCELAADELLHASDDPWQVITLDQIGLQSFGDLLQWLTNEPGKWIYRPSKDRIDMRRVLACRDAFRFAFDFEVLSSAVRLHREGLLDCTRNENGVTFSTRAPRLSFLRGLLDNVASDSETVEPSEFDSRVRSIQDARKLRQAIVDKTAAAAIAELDLIPNETKVNGYSMGQFKTVWRALLIEALMWRSRPERNPLAVSQEDQLREAVKIIRTQELVRGLTQATGQSPDVVRSVIADLLYQKEMDPIFDLWTSPLIPIGTEHVALTPRFVMRNRIARNFPKIWLKRHPKSFHFTVGARVLEKRYVQEIRKLIEPLADPHLVVLHKELRLTSTLGCEVDLAFVDAAHDTLLLVEAKCIIAPDSLRE